MTHNYNITGMTCGKCVAKVKNELLKLGDVASADVDLASQQATITMQKHIPISVLQSALDKAGSYKINESAGHKEHSSDDMPAEKISWWQTYKPLALIGIYIITITFSIELVSGVVDLNNWMQNFMAAFFITFSFFKLLDLKGFAESYSTYDIIARRWAGWGYVYAFIELALGLAFLLRFNPFITNGVTFVVMSISIIGVLQSVLNKRKIRCACLGAVFNLPMSTDTIIEDALMIAMSGIMLISYL